MIALDRQKMKADGVTLIDGELIQANSLNEGEQPPNISAICGTADSHSTNIENQDCEESESDGEAAMEID